MAKLLWMSSFRGSTLDSNLPFRKSGQRPFQKRTVRAECEPDVNAALPGLCKGQEDFFRGNFGDYHVDGFRRVFNGAQDLRLNFLRCEECV